MSKHYTVQIAMEVAARTPEEAAAFALDDLRDRELGPWEMRVGKTGSKTFKTVTTGQVPESPAKSPSPTGP